MATARVTAAGAYVEKDPDNAVRVTAAGAYVERRRVAEIRTTALGAYIEFLAPSGTVDYSQRMRHGKRFANQILQPYGG